MVVAETFPDNEVGEISRRILGLTERQATAVSANGWETLIDFEGYTTSDIETWVTSSSRIAVNRGGAIFASVRTKRIAALSYWVNRRLLRGITIVAAEFDAATLRESLTSYPIYDMWKSESDTAQKPEPFSYDKWTEWQDSVITFLKGTKNVTKTHSLYYIIRSEPNTLTPDEMTEEDEITYHARHTGAAYVSDNRAVHAYLTELTNGTDADQWIRDHSRTRNGREAWIALCRHYDGPAEGDKRVTIARSDINLIHYRNETSFSFEKFSTRLRKAFTTLATYNQPKCEKEKVEILLDHINTSDQRLITAVGICRDRHSDTFDGACTYLSQQITSIFPQHQPNAFGSKGRGGRKHRHRNISAIKRAGGKVTCNGVDITDTTRYLSPKEFTKIGEEGRRYLAKCSKRKAHKNKIANDPPSKKNKSKNDENDRHVAAIINGIMQANRVEREAMSVSGASVPSQITPQMPQHGPHARPRTVSGTTVVTQASQGNVTFDHTGNIVPQS
jgi:hypothetical protein